MGRETVPNSRLTAARKALLSPSGSGRPLSRQELADTCNTELARMYAERGSRQRWAGLTEKTIGAMERGEIRWPNHNYRQALCTILKADERALGLFIDRPVVEDSKTATAPQRKTLASPSEPTGEIETASIQLSLQVDGAEIVVPLSRRQRLQVGAESVVEALAIGQHRDMLYEVARRQVDQLAITSPAHLDEILEHLRDQWHALVRTDNLLGPRFALAGVMNQIAVLEALRPSIRGDQRLAAIRLGAKYAESAAWLFEDTSNMGKARYWTTRAMEWAYEGDDAPMLAWTIFRRSQQAAATRDVADAIGLAQAARRDEDRLATPTKAAIRVQEAFGHALDGAERTSQLLLDEAQMWAANDTAGDARGGHGSYCTASYIEIQRANCWLTTGKPKKAIALYEESLRALPAVYQRNRAGALTRLAAAYLADTQVEQAASVAHVALPVARSSGSVRILDEIHDLGAQMTAHASLPDVAALLDDLRDDEGVR